MSFIKKLTTKKEEVSAGGIIIEEHAMWEGDLQEFEHPDNAGTDTPMAEISASVPSITNQMETDPYANFEPTAPE